MGGAAAVAGAPGPTIGGALTAALSWRAVLLVNLMNLALLRRRRNYLGATLSQFIAGTAEMGLALLFPLLLILNLEMSPALAGLALIPRRFR